MNLNDEKRNDNHNVSYFQKNLLTLGYDTHGVNGRYNVNTKSAVHDFQTANGKLDSVTKEKISHKLKEKTNTIPAQTITTVVEGATLKCTLGTAESNLVIIRFFGSRLNDKKVGTIKEHIGMINIPSFALCKRTSPPPPCIPVTPSDWIIGDATYKAGKIKALSTKSGCIGTFGGYISIVDDGQMKSPIECSEW